MTLRLVPPSDPEVTADLRLREHTARTRPAVSDAEFARGIRDAATPNVIGKVPCRARCGNVTDWTAEAEDAFNTWNRKLARDNEIPLDMTRIVFCDACRKRGAKAAADSNRNHVEAVRAAIRELKETPPKTPSEERAAVRRLEGLRHPFPEECVKAIVERSLTSRGSRRQEDY